MGTFWQDVKYAARMLARNPGFTAVAVLTLALGIGANTTIFTLLKGVVLQPLPGVPAAGQLATIVSTSRAGQPFVLSYPDYRDYRDKNTVFAGLAGSTPVPLSVTISEQPERVWGEIVTGNIFQVLGVRASLGRTLLPEDDQVAGGPAVAVLSDAFWRRRFGADPNVIGRTIHVGKRLFTVVGVAEPRYRGSVVGVALQMFVPVMGRMEFLPMGVPVGDWLEDRNSHWLIAQGRLKPGVTFQQAQAAMSLLGDQVAKEYPNDGIRHRAVLLPLLRSPFGSQALLYPVLSIAMMVVGIVLLVACSNVAGLLLARGARRQREMAIRLAMGANRTRLVRQLLTESVLLSLLGGGAALLLSLWTSAHYGNLKIPTPFPAVIDADLDLFSFGFTLLISVVAAVIFGLAPALQSSKVSLVPALKDDVSGRRFRRSRLRSGLIVAQVALSLMLLISAGLVVRSRANAQEVQPGFDAENLQLLSLDLRPNEYDAASGQAFFRRLLERVQALPGVKSASLSSFLPLLVVGAQSRSVEIEGYMPRRDEDMDFHYNIVTPDYFRSLRIAVVLGREFNARDDEKGPHVVIVNETLARRYWPGQNALGRKLRTAGSWREVVGVVRDIKYLNLNETPMPYVYLPLAQNYRGDMTLHVRAAGAPAGLVITLQNEIRALDKNLPVFDVRTMKEHMFFAMAGYSLAEELLGAAGLQALLLAVVGIYGVISFSVAQRTQEIGVRMALGAQRSDIFRLVVGQGFVLIALGVAFGLSGAFAATRVMAGLLYGVSARDPLTFVGVSLVLMSVALLACYVPARRAVKVEPMTALRYE